MSKPSSTPETRAALNSLMEERGISQRQVAKALGLSETAVSQFRSGSYPGDSTKIAESVEAFLQREYERKLVNKQSLPFAKIRNAKRLFEVARLAHIENEIAVVYGDAGSGKTTAAREYARLNKDVIFIEADLGYTAKILFKEIATKLNLPDTGNIHDIFEDIHEKLKNSGRLIIIDEAEHLPYRALELVRRLHDKTDVGLLLCGMPRLIANLRGKRGEYAQLYSRVGIAVKLESLNEEDTVKLVESVFNNCNGLSAEFHARCKGNTRSLSKLIYRAKRIAEINSTQVSKAVITRAAEMILV